MRYIRKNTIQYNIFNKPNKFLKPNVYYNIGFIICFCSCIDFHHVLILKILLFWISIWCVCVFQLILQKKIQQKYYNKSTIQQNFIYFFFWTFWMHNMCCYFKQKFNENYYISCTAYTQFDGSAPCVQQTTIVLKSFQTKINSKE